MARWLAQLSDGQGGKRNGKQLPPNNLHTLHLRQRTARSRVQNYRLRSVAMPLELRRRPLLFPCFFIHLVRCCPSSLSQSELLRASLLNRIRLVSSSSTRVDVAAAQYRHPSLLPSA
jgi:hypothetical protein